MALLYRFIILTGYHFRLPLTHLKSPGKRDLHDLGSPWGSVVSLELLWKSRNELGILYLQRTRLVDYTWHVATALSGIKLQYRSKKHVLMIREISSSPTSEVLRTYSWIGYSFPLLRSKRCLK